MVLRTASVSRDDTQAWKNDHTAIIAVEADPPRRLLAFRLHPQGLAGPDNRVSTKDTGFAVVRVQLCHRATRSLVVRNSSRQAARCVV